MKDMQFVEVVESCYFPETDGFPEEHNGDFTYIIDMSKVDKFAIDNEWEFRYVAGIVEAIRASKQPDDTSRKYSFSDAPEWYADMMAPAGTVAQKRVSYKIYV